MDQARLNQLVTMPIRHYPTIDSTNLAAKRLINNEKITAPLALVADEQTAGYGRHGRQYFSPKQVGIYLTLIWPINNLAKLNPGQVTTSMAVAATEALSTTLAIQVGIKWVNDLYYKHKKVAGILVELVPDAQQPQQGHLVIGIGLNINPTDYPQTIQDKAGALTQQVVDQELLVATLLARFQAVFTQDSVLTMAAYRSYSLVLNQAVELVVGKEIVTGQVLDVLDDGGLLVQTTAGQRAFYSGEITKLNMTGWTIS